MNNELKIDEIYPNSIFIDNEPTRHELFEKVVKLQQENKELHNKIDKTIEYINNFPLIHYSSTEKIDGKRLSGKLVPVDELLEILKDGDVDECE